MKLKNTIKCLDTVILRTPFFPINNFIEIPKDKSEVSSFIKELFLSNEFKEAIFLASPELYYEWEKLNNGHPFNDVKRIRLEKSLLKYYIRATTNCVPFGLFSTYSVLQKENTNRSISYERFTNIDMLFIASILKLLNKKNNVRNILNYSINNTIFIIGNECRYIEEKSIGESKNYTLSSLKLDPILELIISECKQERKIDQLSETLLESIEGVTYAECKAYVNELIHSQLLIGSLNICLNGKPPFDQLLDFLNDNSYELIQEDENFKKIVSTLNELRKKIKIIDNNVIGNKISIYEEIFSIVDNLNIDYDKKYLINSNLKKISNTSLNMVEEDKKHLDKAIELLSKFSIISPEKKFSSSKNIKEFKKAFIDRYEDAEISFLLALDNVSGIGYIQSNNVYNSFSPLIDDIKFPFVSSDSENISSNSKEDSFWTNLILKAYKNNELSINLENEDLSQFKDRRFDLTGTFPLMYSKINDKIHIISAGGGSALHYLGRFTCNDKEISSFGNDISKVEKDLFPDKILAEILHLASNRAGNISIRNIDREYEISILAQTSGKAIRISLDDILISVKNDKVILRSKSLNKEIIPFLASAQNFHNDTLPAYHLLCDLQSQYRTNDLSLNINNFITRHFNFIPRIEYGKNLILSPAYWKLPKSDIIDLLDSEDNIVYDKFKKFRKKHNIPRFIKLWEKGSDSLAIDTENLFMLDILNDYLKKNGYIRFNEFLYNASENNNDSVYANEFVVSFEANKLQTKNNLPKKQLNNSIQKKFMPGDQWLFYKVYTGVNTANNLLINEIIHIVDELYRSESIYKWFFIRYKDPDFHLRIRFHFKNIDARNHIINMFNEKLKPLVKSKFIWKIDISTYNKELERYEFEQISLSEKIFSLDSKMVINLIDISKKRNEEDHIWLYSLKYIDSLLDVFQLKLENKYDIMSQLYQSFSIEFNSNKKLRKQIDYKYRSNLKVISEIFGEQNEYISVINYTKNLIQPIALNITKLVDNTEIYNLIASYIHMHINRIIKSNPRMHELVLYGILEKFYKREIGLKKHKINLVKD